MRIPRIKGLIRRRLLVNYRADPAVVQRLLPPPFRPKLHAGHALVGICLIRLERIRPVGLPGFLGLKSENAAHRFAVQWTDADGVEREGVFIPRRDTGSLLNRLAGGRLFPGVHNPARFSVTDRDGHIDFSMRSIDGSVAVHVVGDDTDALPSTSCFESLAASSAFFAAGSLGYSVTHDPLRSNGVRLKTDAWLVRPLRVTDVRSSYFACAKKFPTGSVTFDHALIMRDLPHEWIGEDDFQHAPSPQQTPEPSPATST